MSQSDSAHPVSRRGFRVDLCPMDDDDLPFLTRSINDQDVNEGLTVIYPMNRKDEAKWVESLGAHRPDDIIFAVRLRGNPQIIGSIGLHHVKPFDRVATLGYYLGKEYWGKGYGTEAVMLIVEYAFNTLNLQKIAAEVYDFNKASLKCLDKCGFKEEGKFMRHRFRSGRYVDCYQLAVFREGFLLLWEKYKSEQTKGT